VISIKSYSVQVPSREYFVAMDNCEIKVISHSN
jgi:hypothetical protein